MIPTGTPASTAQGAPPSGVENCTGKFAKLSLPKFIPRSLDAPQSSGSRSLNPGRSPLRLRIIM